jgi:hypothetical protein
MYYHRRPDIMPTDSQFKIDGAAEHFDAGYLLDRRCRRGAVIVLGMGSSGRYARISAIRALPAAPRRSLRTERGAAIRKLGKMNGNGRMGAGIKRALRVDLVEAWSVRTDGGADSAGDRRGIWNQPAVPSVRRLSSHPWGWNRTEK